MSCKFHVNRTYSFEIIAIWNSCPLDGFYQLSFLERQKPDITIEASALSSWGSWSWYWNVILSIGCGIKVFISNVVCLNVFSDWCIWWLHWLFVFFFHMFPRVILIDPWAINVTKIILRSIFSRNIEFISKHIFLMLAGAIFMSG